MRVERHPMNDDIRKDDMVFIGFGSRLWTVLSLDGEYVELGNEDACKVIRIHRAALMKVERVERHR